MAWHGFPDATMSGRFLSGILHRKPAKRHFICYQSFVAKAQHVFQDARHPPLATNTSRPANRILFTPPKHMMRADPPLSSLKTREMHAFLPMAPSHTTARGNFASDYGVVLVILERRLQASSSFVMSINDGMSALTPSTLLTMPKHKAPLHMSTPERRGGQHQGSYQRIQVNQLYMCAHQTCNVHIDQHKRQ
ncbi:predicted protein [Plenodomus lingam JN3]|uniref:Predicted protein n=1 Tax=Leptosphaeria maculans (strain JN3 / isolate v23.1.3 / race Av1-4-5-6-7-8) TaxID=985895 RepID=E4ZS14_LEPMJ|nr:predicted protein [Plenodomus lingam JN3]CBX94194.1 predicted protein [Plenodomus lingam JN3]